MKKAVTLLIVAIFLFSLISAPAAKSDTMPIGAVMTKFFNLTSIPTPQQINYFNKVFSLGTNLSGKMVIGSDGSPMLAVFQVGSGKLDWYKWNGSKWMYQYSLSNIVPGFEEPQTLKSYKYVTWNEYTKHVVDTGNSNPVNTTNPLTVTLTGPTSGAINATYTYTATITGGTVPYTLTWSADGFVSKSGVSANYKWSTGGVKKVEVYVKDSLGQTGSASLNVTISTPVSITGPETNIVYKNSLGGLGFKTHPRYQVSIQGIDNFTINYFKVGNVSVADPVERGILIPLYGGDGRTYVFNTAYLETIFKNVSLGTVPFEVSVADNTSGKTIVVTKNFNIFYAVIPRFDLGANVLVEAPTVPDPPQYTLTLTEIRTEFVPDPTPNPNDPPKYSWKTSVYSKTITVNAKFDTIVDLNDYVAKHPDLAAQLEAFRNNPAGLADKSSSEIVTTDDIRKGGPLIVESQHKQLETQVGNKGGFFFPVVTNQDPISFKGLVAAVIKEVDGKNVVAPYQREVYAGSNDESTVVPGILSAQWFGINNEAGWWSIDPQNGGGNYGTCAPLFPNGNPIYVKWVGDSPAVDKFHFDLEFVLDRSGREIRWNYNGDISGWVITDRVYQAQIIEKSPFDISGTIYSCEHAPSTRPITSIIYLVNPDANNALGNGEYKVQDITLKPASQVTFNDILSQYGIFSQRNPIVVSAAYTHSCEITSLLWSPSSLTFNDANMQGILVQYYQNDGTFLIPRGTDSGILKDGNGKSIAGYRREKGVILVYPLSKGSTTLTIPSSSLGGPQYLPGSPVDVTIPITVNVDIGTVQISVNGIDVNNLGPTEWLGGTSARSRGYYDSSGVYHPGSLIYKYGIWKYWMWQTGKLDSDTYTTGTKSSNLTTALNSTPLHTLNVSIVTSGNVKVRFTLSGDGLSPVSVTSSTDFAAGALKTWVINNLSAIKDATTGYKVYKSLNYKIEVSYDNGNTWETLKVGQDTVIFEKNP